ncbi:hypothetical protein FF098_001650 [Parvularcula flava]|uniref:Uncharacterized protein n=1 Tax=Aquisalinus luteolus TaxID=1566827 RepID=A0A8J3A470_9PROT|nr:hypothetical protein [Aquisalinus luteolus]NHK26609.1 hypothetical protein [Aquisalinus luteolus]GGH92860.1 hypothetical protein GCM10011355_03350 [Aquisalinus luteolus]
MTLSSMKASLRAYERKVFTGAKALAGAGAVAVVATWQQQLAELDTTRDQFIAATGENELVSGAYQHISGSLDGLSAVIGSGDKEAIMAAAMQFYASLTEAHSAFGELVPLSLRGEDTVQPETLMRLSGILGSALGLS